MTKSKEKLLRIGERKQISRHNDLIYLVDTYLIGHWTAIYYGPDNSREVLGRAFRTQNEARKACETHFEKQLEEME